LYFVKPSKAPKEAVMGEPKFFRDVHRAYVSALGDKKDTLEYCMTEHLRMSGVYWGVMAMELISAGEEMKKPEIVEWVLSCQNPDGGFGGTNGHDSHMLYTLSAIQLLALGGALHRIDPSSVVGYVAGLQNRTTGAFAGDKWGEIDTRFSYCALNCLSLLGRLDAVDVPLAVEFILACKNFDGGFGCVPGAESHAGQIFTCVGALSIAGMHHWLLNAYFPFAFR
jgi:geranylgeranyl transferase type-2 subunit beta